MGQCPYCSNQIKDGERFCLGCGRQLDVGGITEEIKSGGISDLKKCFGSFPVTQIDCYLCADEQKCANFTASIKQDKILSKLNKIDDINNSLANMNNTLANMNTYLKSIDANIVLLTRKK